MEEPLQHWQWQAPGTTWKGVGLYHITLTVPSREPLLGTLVIPDNDPARSSVKYSALGKMIVNALWEVPSKHTEIQVLHYCLMPDHLHAVWYVRRTMTRGIKSAVRGFWQGIKKIGRAYSYLTSVPSPSNPSVSGASVSYSSFVPVARLDDFQEVLRALQTLTPLLRQQLGDEAYYSLPPVFTEMLFIRPMGQRRQLPATIRYIDMNPQRLATKRLMPGFFSVQEGIELARRTYSGVGNIALLQAEQYAPVHVRSMWVKDAELHHYQRPLRDYMNGCVIAARKGTVMVSPFISPQEKMVMETLLREKRPFILLADNGFRDYYKPSDHLFDACAEGRILILSPWKYNSDKRHISRSDCVALNNMAEEICNALNTPLASVAPDASVASDAIRQNKKE